MGKLRLSKWLGLYALLPLMIALIAIVDTATTRLRHPILLAGIAVFVCALALTWIDRHPLLVELGEAGSTDAGNPVKVTHTVWHLHDAFEDECRSTPIRHRRMDCEE